MISCSMSFLTWNVFLLLSAAASASSAIEINPLDELLSDPFIAKEHSKRSAPFPPERCDSYFGSPDVTDCVSAVKLMVSILDDETRRESYDTFTNDIHIPGLEAHAKHEVPAAWYGTLGR